MRDRQHPSVNYILLESQTSAKNVLWLNETGTNCFFLTFMLLHSRRPVNHAVRRRKYWQNISCATSHNSPLPTTFAEENSW